MLKRWIIVKQSCSSSLALVNQALDTNCFNSMPVSMNGLWPTNREKKPEALTPSQEAALVELTVPWTVCCSGSNTWTPVAHHEEAYFQTGRSTGGGSAAVTYSVTRDP